MAGRTLVVARCDEWRFNCTVHETVDDANRYQDADPGHDLFSQYPIDVNVRCFILVAVKKAQKQKFALAVSQFTADKNIDDMFINLVYRTMCWLVGCQWDNKDLLKLLQMAGTCLDTFVALCNERVRDVTVDAVIEAQIVDLHHGQNTRSAARPISCSCGLVAGRVS